MNIGDGRFKMHDCDFEGLCWSSTQMHILEMLLDGILNGYEHMFRWARVDPAKAMEVCSFIIKQPEMPIRINKLYRQQKCLLYYV